MLEPLAELLLLERQALRLFRESERKVSSYFRRAAAQLAALPDGAAARAAMLRDRVREVNGMYSMPPAGRSGGLPLVFDGDDDGALVVSDDDVVVLD